MESELVGTAYVISQMKNQSKKFSQLLLILVGMEWKWKQNGKNFLFHIIVNLIKLIYSEDVGLYAGAKRFLLLINFISNEDHFWRKDKGERTKEKEE